jgi:nicotinate phosphoribosyltransferase
MKQIIQHLTDNDAYTFSCQYYVLQKYPRAEVEYTFFDRNKERFPHGFGELLKEQIGFMPHVMITEDEIAFMKRKMYYLPEWYFTFLRGYRFNPHEVSVSQDEEGHLAISVRGKWFSTIMWEMPILSIVSELMHNLRGDIQRYDPNASMSASSRRHARYSRADWCWATWARAAASRSTIRTW